MLFYVLVHFIHAHIRVRPHTYTSAFSHEDTYTFVRVHPRENPHAHVHDAYERARADTHAPFSSPFHISKSRSCLARGGEEEGRQAGREYQMHIRARTCAHSHKLCLDIICRLGTALCRVGYLIYTCMCMCIRTRAVYVHTRTCRESVCVLPCSYSHSLQI